MCRTTTCAGKGPPAPCSRDSASVHGNIASTCFVSLYTVCVQEKDHLQLAVERVAAMRPDVLLVERSVARSAQDALLRKGISLVLNVKPKLLERLARCTGAQVAPSVEHLNHACVAFCKEFAVDSLVCHVSPAFGLRCCTSWTWFLT